MFMGEVVLSSLLVLTVNIIERSIMGLEPSFNGGIIKITT